MKKLLLILMLLTASLAEMAPSENIEFCILKAEPIYTIDLHDIDVLLSEYKVHHKIIVKSQILLETNYLSSYLYRVNKNLIGMRHPSIRETTSIGINKGHAVYKSYRDCIKDYSIWQKLFYKEGEDYYVFLQRIGYATDPLYIKKLKSMSI